MGYAQIQAGQIVGFIPTPTRPVFHGGRWYDCRDEAIRAEYLAAGGYVPVIETVRPADTAATTHDRGYSIGAAEVTVTWAERPKTAEELAAQAEAAAWEAQQAADRAALDALATTASAAHTDGEPWQQPAGAHDAYPLAATVTHDGKTWESLTPFNVWAPGVSGWRELVAVGYPAWVQPTGAHDAYAKGARVSFEGSDYESLIDGNVWSPTAYPAGWLKL